ncbi:hypothetical protein [Pseudomonas sp. NMS19W]|uniref:hypothetical protein n=1 Tax=Pseudomonas sp. NMS19W TaxID=3079768 RepID=UPI003F655240
MQFFAAAIVGLTLIFCLGAIFGKDDHDVCDAALEKLTSIGEQSFPVGLQEEYRKVIDAHASGEYKTCVNLANKTLEHLKRG